MLNTIKLFCRIILVYPRQTSLYFTESRFLRTLKYGRDGSGNLKPLQGNYLLRYLRCGNTAERSSVSTPIVDMCNVSFIHLWRHI